MYSNILVPISLEESRDSARALDVAKALAGEGGKVTALHVVEEVPAYVADHLPAGHAAAAMIERERDLGGVIGDRKGIVVDVVSGHSGRTILDYAERTGVDCIILASHRPGMQDYFLGSTAARVVRHAECSVHVVR